MNNFNEWIEKSHPECYYGRNIISIRTRFLNYKARRHPLRLNHILMGTKVMDFTLPELDRKPKNMGVIGHIDHGAKEIASALSNQNINVTIMNPKEKTIEEHRSESITLAYRNYTIPPTEYRTKASSGNDKKEAETKAKNKAKRKAKRKSQKRNKR